MINKLEEYLLNQLDNNTTVIWIKKQLWSDIITSQMFQILRLILLQNDFLLQDSHISSSLNFVADPLLRCFDYSINEIIHNMIHNCKSNNFKSSNLIIYQDLYPHLYQQISAILQCLIQRIVLLPALTKEKSLLRKDSLHSAQNQILKILTSV